MSPRTRITRVEKKLADREERKRLANCTCRSIVKCHFTNYHRNRLSITAAVL